MNRMTMAATSSADEQAEYMLRVPPARFLIEAIVLVRGEMRMEVLMCTNKPTQAVRVYDLLLRAFRTGRPLPADAPDEVRAALNEAGIQFEDIGILQLDTLTRYARRRFRNN